MSRTPAYLYHPEHEPRVFESEEELAAALADGWVDSPAKVESVTSPPGPAVRPEGIPEDVWTDVAALMAHGRSIGMTLGPKYKLETLQAKVCEFMGQAKGAE